MKLHNLINLSTKEAILVQDLYNGFPDEGIEKEFRVESEDSDEESTTMYQLRKVEFLKKKRLIEEEENKTKKMDPFIILQGVLSDSESKNKIFRLSYQEKTYEVREGILQEGKLVELSPKNKKITNGFIFGENWHFLDEKANTGAVLYYETMRGWYIKGFDIEEWKVKQSQTLVSVPTYDKMLEKEESSAVILEEKMVLHIDGYSFLIGMSP